MNIKYVINNLFWIKNTAQEAWHVTPPEKETIAEKLAQTKADVAQEDLDEEKEEKTLMIRSSDHPARSRHAHAGSFEQGRIRE